MLTGRTPFAGMSPQAMLAAHATRPPEPVAGTRPNAPASLSTLIMRCLEKDPADRYQSAGKVLRGARAVGGGGD